MGLEPSALGIAAAAVGTPTGWWIVDGCGRPCRAPSSAGDEAARRAAAINTTFRQPGVVRRLTRAPSRPWGGLAPRKAATSAACPRHHEASDQRTATGVPERPRCDAGGVGPARVPIGLAWVPLLSQACSRSRRHLPR